MTDTTNPPAGSGTDDLPSSSPGHQTAPENNWVGLAALVGLLALLWVRAGWEYVVIVAAIIVIIFLHELGHYVAAKRGGMKVTEFFIGFGPRIWSFRRGETEYGIKAIPAGAYVKIPGMNMLEDVDPADERRTYREQSFPRRLAVAVAGSAMHFALALGMIYLLLVGHGIEADETQWSVAEAIDDGAAQAMGLTAGDRITAIDGQPVETFADLSTYVSARPGADITVAYVRDGQSLTAVGTIGTDPADPERGLLGVRYDPGALPGITYNPIAAVPETAATFGEFSKLTVESMAKLFSPSGLADFFGGAADSGDDDAGGAAADGGAATDENRLVSIVGATQLGADAVNQGIASVLFFLVLFNVFIGIFNMVPLLPLDGGHVLIAVYERVREFGRAGRYHADVTKMLPVAWAVMGLLVAVGMVAIFRDITDPIQL